MQSDAHLGHALATPVVSGGLDVGLGLGLGLGLGYALATPVVSGRLDVGHPILHEGQREDEERERHEGDHHLWGAGAPW